MGFIGSQGLTDGDDEDGVIGRYAKPRRLQQLTLNLEVKGRREGAQEVVCG